MDVVRDQMGTGCLSALGPHGTVLLVEDDDDTREALREVLASEGYRVLSARNGRDALDKLRHTERPNLILLDMMMPEMDGFEFRRQQQSDPSLKDVPVAVLTAGYTAPWDVDLVLLKPISLEKLRRALRIAAR